ncbi:hypothetical protein [Sphingomonas aerolata]|uniref:hypothetical protein n=1 Tax=Sphingomonas aerolata TaxID=185951 RepID=UPI002FE15DB3
MVAMGATLVPMGSAAAKAMAVVDGRADAYLHDGGQYEWDNCAPAAVAIAADCMRRGSTAARWSTTASIRCSPIC